MRKMKKINGYLVVKFNARELREYEGTALGEYGVIDAELYTCNLDVDRGAMEYDNAGSMEEAVELARGSRVGARRRGARGQGHDRQGDRRDHRGGRSRRAADDRRMGERPPGAGRERPL